MSKNRISRLAGLALFYAQVFCLQAQVSTDSLILHLPMNGNANDISGNGNNGTPINVVVDADRDGNPEGAYRFNGTDGTIEIPASPSINQIQKADQISITSWVKRNNVNGDVFAILERYDPAVDASYILELNTYVGGIQFGGNASSPDPAALCNYSNWNANQWYHIGFTYSKTAGVAKFYVDAVNVCSTPYTTEIAISDSTASFWVGRSLTGPNEFSSGLMDDLKVFYRVLTPVEIDTIFTTETRERQLKHHFTVYPNPSKEFIGIDDLPAGSVLSLSSLSGKTVYGPVSKSGQTSIPTSGLLNGLYILRVESHGRISNRKVMVNR
jgi:hypothetical protein